MEANIFSDQQLRSFAKNFYDFQTTFDSKEYFDTEDYNYVANNPQLAKYAEELNKKDLFEAEATNPLENESPAKVAKEEGAKKAGSAENTKDGNENKDKNLVQPVKPQQPSTTVSEDPDPEWLEETANTPAARAFKEGTEQQKTEWDKLRWEAKERYDLFKKNNNRR